MSITKIVLISLAILPVFASVIPLSDKTHWTVRAFDFPRPQFALLGLCVFAVYALFCFDTPLDFAILAAILLATARQVYLIFPYTPLAAKQVMDAQKPHPDNTLGLVVANVLKPNRNVERLLRSIRETDPDIILTLETDKWWEAQLQVLEKDYPHTLKCPQDNLYGMHFYSRLAIENPQIHFLVEEDVPSMHVKVRLRSGHPVDLRCLHPAPPSPTENTASRERDAELLLVGKAVTAYKGSVIVTGDLNDVAWSRTTTLFKKISGLLDPRIGRGMYSTYNAKYWFLRWPLDHLFHSNDFTLVSIGTLPYFGSDHFPIHVTLSHEPEKKQVQPAPEADEEDEKLARKKIRQGNGEPVSVKPDLSVSMNEEKKEE